MGGSQRLHGMAHGAVGTNHGSWATHTRRNTEGRDERTSSELIRCLRLALPSAGPAVGGRLDRHPADSRRAVAPAGRGPARTLGASKRHKPQEWPRSGVQPQKIRVLLSRDQLFHSEIHGDLGLGDVGNRDHMSTSSAAVNMQTYVMLCYLYSLLSTLVGY